MSGMDNIIKEKISADHLLYVSLKYTKTCDVILNLLLRWKKMIEMGLDNLIEESKKKKKWKPIPDAPRAKIVQLKRIYHKFPEIAETLELYEFFRDVENLDKVRENEFRKGVNLRVIYKGDTVNVNLDKLAEYSEKLEKFISHLK
jgi:pyoverdine/dityrosine biosynthesis protein Dit1